MKKITLHLFLVALCFSAFAQGPKPPVSTIDYVSDELERVIKKDAKVEIIAEGFQFTEGPVWVDKEKMLLLSDVPANTIYKWTEAKGKEVYLKPAGYTDSTKRGGFMGSNGLVVSNEGKLLLCQHGDRRIAMMDAPINAPQPKFTTVAGAYDGKRINSPNDLFLTKSGDLYFTDPSYGFEKGRDPQGTQFQGVYKVDKAGKITLLLDSIEQPNGIAVFPDGKTLLVSNSGRKKGWYSYEIASNGTLTNGKVFYNAINERGPGGCDGFKIDKDGNVFASGPGGVFIFNKTGKQIGKISINGSTASNCALSPDNKTLYITATRSLLRVKMR